MRQCQGKGQGHIGRGHTHSQSQSQRKRLKLNLLTHITTHTLHSTQRQERMRVGGGWWGNNAGLVMSVGGVYTFGGYLKVERVEATTTGTEAASFVF